MIVSICAVALASFVVVTAGNNANDANSNNGPKKKKKGNKVDPNLVSAETNKVKQRRAVHITAVYLSLTEEEKSSITDLTPKVYTRFNILVDQDSDLTPQEKARMKLGRGNEPYDGKQLWDKFSYIKSDIFNKFIPAWKSVTQTSGKDEEQIAQEALQILHKNLDKTKDFHPNWRPPYWEAFMRYRTNPVFREPTEDSKKDSENGLVSAKVRKEVKNRAQQRQKEKEYHKTMKRASTVLVNNTDKFEYLQTKKEIMQRKQNKMEQATDYQLRLNLVRLGMEQKREGAFSLYDQLLAAESQKIEEEHKQREETAKRQRLAAQAAAMLPCRSVVENDSVDDVGNNNDNITVASSQPPSSQSVMDQSSSNDSPMIPINLAASSTPFQSVTQDGGDPTTNGDSDNDDEYGGVGDDDDDDENYDEQDDPEKATRRAAI